MKSITTQKHISALIERELSKLSLPDEPALLYEPVEYTLSLAGKRIRPLFVLNACGMCGGKVEEAVPAALAIELLHNFTLLHDDIMDAAETRRGEPSVFKKWDSSTAILSGDVMFSRAFEQLQYYGKREEYTKKQYTRIMDIFLESAKTVCEGQAYDLEFARRNNVTIDQYLKMIRGKTAALISGSFMLGAAVSGVGEEILASMKKLGVNVGIAFQIQDDLLDVIADPSKFGKTQGGDIMESKKTYLSILALQRGDEEQKELLNRIFSREEVLPEQVDTVISMYHELGVVEETKRTIERYYLDAKSLLERFPASDYKSILIGYFSKLKNREF